VQSYTRHQLKEDKFASFVGKEMQLASANRRTIMAVLAAAAIVVALLAGIFVYINSRDDKASVALGEAMRTYTAPLRAPEAPVNPDVKTFLSSKERAQAAGKEFSQIATDYSSTRNGKFARYMAGVAAVEAGDLKLAYAQFEELETFARFGALAVADM